MLKLKKQADQFHKWLDELSSIDQPFLGPYRIDKLYLYSINDPEYEPYEEDNYTLEDFVSSVCGFVKGMFNILTQSPYHDQIPNLNTFVDKFNPEQFKYFNPDRSKDKHQFSIYLDELTSTNTTIALVTIIKMHNDLYQQFKPLPSKDALQPNYLKSKYYWLDVYTDDEEDSILEEDPNAIEFDRSDLI